VQSLSYSQARRNLKATLDRVCEDHQPALVTRKNGGNVVLLSEEDFSSLEETAYLLRSPANARRLFGALERDRRGERGRSLDSVLEKLELDDVSEDRV
jgi:antitoxin YefM